MHRRPRSRVGQAWHGDACHSPRPPRSVRRRRRPVAPRHCRANGAEAGRVMQAGREFLYFLDKVELN